MVYGYDRQRAMSARAGKAVIHAVRQAQGCASLPLA
jgi:hypothetical protein